MVALFAALLVFLPAAAGHAFTRPAGTTCQAGDTMITIANFSFTPSDVTIPSNGTACWTVAAGSSYERSTQAMSRRGCTGEQGVPPGAGTSESMPNLTA